MEFENLSASYDVGIAKKYGINCAVLLNKLIYLSKYTSRQDGYCWRTAKELEDELGLSTSQQQVAIKKLEDAGIIKTKNTYIVGTQIKCKHFKLLENKENLKCDLEENLKSDLQKTYKSVNNNKTYNNTNNSYYINNIDLAEFFEENLGRTLAPIEFEKIKEWQKDYKEEFIKEALKVSILNNKRNFNYINAILKNWKTDGYTSIKEIKQKNQEKEPIELFDYNWFEEENQ